MSEMKHTPGPWEWRLIGKDWVLWGAYGHRPIVMDGKKLRLRNNEHCIMVPFADTHPDARLIATAPLGYKLAKCITGNGSPFSLYVRDALPGGIADWACHYCGCYSSVGHTGPCIYVLAQEIIAKAKRDPNA